MKANTSALNRDSDLQLSARWRPALHFDYKGANECVVLTKLGVFEGFCTMGFDFIIVCASVDCMGHFNLT